MHRVGGNTQTVIAMSQNDFVFGITLGAKKQSPEVGSEANSPLRLAHFVLTTPNPSLAVRSKKAR